MRRLSKKPNILIKFIRDEDRNPVGCVVSTGRNKLGWSLCSDQDKFNKKIAKHIAIGRSLGDDKSAEYWRDWIISANNTYFGKSPNKYIGAVIVELFIMQERSFKYWKEN